MALEESSFRVEGMSCDHCRNAVVGALMALEGVEGTEVDLASGIVRATYQAGKTSPEALKRAIQEAGYEVKEIW